ncbi:DUF484 family protein [Celeribacter litoreus]|uniref:DUF484 family protein n=1 Tax=Celeribacter litoreus TaxID=2876714 RepID=UPI001CCB748E|nr:DUF484 family protein [Celeribacter litoreus]MCA0044010.1 DUF484 family protein [Celeribacter litoreus]
MSEDLREKIISTPEVVLDDPDVMRALISAKEDATGSNIVDLRGLAMERLEERLERLEDTHRDVIAAAYENQAGTNQIHRAVLKLLDAETLEGLLELLAGPISRTLRIDAVKLLLETEDEGALPTFADPNEIAVTTEPGFIDTYITYGRNRPARQITLRTVAPAQDLIYGNTSGFIRSEALMKLDLGDDRMPALLVFGSEEETLFKPSQGTDLLAFFSGATERVLRRWIG